MTRCEVVDMLSLGRAYVSIRQGDLSRWVCAVQFDILDASLTRVLAHATWYLNLGSGEKPRAGRRGGYWAAWVRANNGMPNRNDHLSPSVFVKRYAALALEVANDP
jgi:hypothetical protein